MDLQEEEGDGIVDPREDGRGRRRTRLDLGARRIRDEAAALCASDDRRSGWAVDGEVRGRDADQIGRTPEHGEPEARVACRPRVERREVVSGVQHACRRRGAVHPETAVELAREQVASGTAVDERRKARERVLHRLDRDALAADLQDAITR